MSGAAAVAPLDVETRLGRFAIDPADIVTFAHGLPGFEGCRRFVLVGGPQFAPFTCLHGVDAPSPSFLTIDPCQVVTDYDVRMSGAERLRLGLDDNTAVLWLAIVHVDDDALSANLRAPVVVNPSRMLGLQMMASESAYSTDHRLLGALTTPNDD